MSTQGSETAAPPPLPSGPAAIPVLTTAAEMRRWSRERRRAGRRVALVPTMGALHAGHEALVAAAAGSGAATVVSIFVNPAQFGPQEDLGRYPRRLQADVLQAAGSGAAAVFAPAELYAADHTTWVEEESLSRPMEGERRPGHFRGVLTVVLKLFNIVEPDLAVFGQKDAQQALLVRRMVRDLDAAVDIKIEPTVREADGLALSSRNAYLAHDQRRRAAALWQALQAGRDRLAAGETAALEILAAARAPLAGMDVEYLELVDLATLEGCQRVRGAVLLAAAVRLGNTRLIDNIIYPQDALADLSFGAKEA